VREGAGECVSVCVRKQLKYLEHTNAKTEKKAAVDRSAWCVGGTMCWGGNTCVCAYACVRVCVCACVRVCVCVCVCVGGGGEGGVCTNALTMLRYTKTLAVGFVLLFAAACLTSIPSQSIGD
jgi:hypothetical protein